MDFKTFYRQLTPDQREAFAQKVQTTVGYCHQIAYGKRIELGLADAIVAVAPTFGGVVTLGELELTDRAKAQDEIRRTARPPANEPWNGVDRRGAANA
jgi:hypothetical protein